MNLPQFTQLIQSIQQPFDQQLRTQASEAYFNLLKDQPESFILNMIQIFQQQDPSLDELVFFCSIILRKEITMQGPKSAFYRVDENAKQQLIVAVLQKLAVSQQPLARSLGDVAGEIAALMLPNCPVVLEFVDAAFQQNDVMRVEAAHIVSVISNANIKKLNQFGMPKILEFIERSLADNQFDSIVHGISSIQTLLISNQFVNSVDDMLAGDLQIKLLDVVIQKLYFMSSQIDECRRQFLKALEIFSDLLDLCAEVISQFLPVIIQLIQALLQSGPQNEDLYKIGANYLASITDSGDMSFIEFSPEQFQEIVTMVVESLLPVFLLITDEEVSDYLSIEDPESLEDPNSVRSVVYDALLRIFGSQFASIALPSLQLFSKSKQEKWQYSYAIIMILDIIICCQSYNANQVIPTLIPQLFKQLQTPQPIIVYRAELAIKHLINYYRHEVQVIEQVVTECLLVLPSIFVNQQPLTHIGAVQILTTLLEIVKPQQFFKLQPLSIQVIQTLYLSNNIILQTQCIQIICHLLEKSNPRVLKEQILDQLKSIVFKFLELQMQLTLSMSQQQIKYFSALTTATSKIISFYHLEFEEVSEQVVVSFVNLIKSPISDEIHMFMDVLINALGLIVKDYSNYIESSDLNQIIFIFIHIIQTPLFNEDKNSLLSAESSPSFNSHIRSQQSNVYQAIAQLIKSIPTRMAEHLQAILSAFAQKNVFSTYSFTDISNVCFLVPRIMKINNSTVDNILAYITNLIQISILKPEISRCSEEVAKIMLSLSYFVEELLQWNGENQSIGPLFTDIILTAVQQLIKLAISSIAHWIDELEYEDLERSERIQCINEEIQNVKLISERINIIVRIFSTFSNFDQVKAHLIQVSEELSEQVSFSNIFMLPLYEITECKQSIIQNNITLTAQRLAVCEYAAPLDAQLATLIILENTELSRQFEQAASQVFIINNLIFNGDSAVFLLAYFISVQLVDESEKILTQINLSQFEGLMFIQALIIMIQRGFLVNKSVISLINAVSGMQNIDQQLLAQIKLIIIENQNIIQTNFEELSFAGKNFIQQ
ncbi:hypothetical protein SS50377_21271 [Spironucleus salmonicida]|uniref:Importin beta-3 subunit n=1 Tax=Spironucleus salmonicida TaxID=348837 RepID=V6LJY6_9EUKA|nr:hypothetical protein SS50377_21271 [Spironucleus salmonicida]|eukprot:EST44041.1 hypothetical protein SS50377_16351 [Spironucleus salmonicida]